MRIVFLAPYTLVLKMGGFEAQVYHIFDELKALNVDVRWYYEISDFQEVDILQVFSTDTSMIPYIIKAKSAGVKIVLTPMQGSRAVSNKYLKLANALSPIPQLFTAHRLTASMIRMADHLCPLCSFEANRMMDVYRVIQRRVTIIPNGISQSFLDGNPIEKDLPFNNYILIVGRIEKNKNQYNLIKACNELNANLILVGDIGMDGDAYLEACKNISGSNIHYWGVEKNPLVLKYLYQNATLTAIPSYSEMVPLVAFESLSQKTPVICTNRCGINGDVISGLFFSDISAEALVKTINQIYSQNQIEFTEQGIFSWSDIANQYMSVYSKVLE